MAHSDGTEKLKSNRSFSGPCIIPHTRGTVFKKLTAHTRGWGDGKTGLKAQCSIEGCAFCALVARSGCKYMKKIVFFLAAAVAALPFVCQAQSELNLNPSRVVGQPTLNFKSANPNVVDARSLYSPWAVAVDTTSTPPALFVSDTFNNRVLGWRNATQIRERRESRPDHGSVGSAVDRTAWTGNVSHAGFHYSRRFGCRFTR